MFNGTMGVSNNSFREYAPKAPISDTCHIVVHKSFIYFNLVLDVNLVYFYIDDGFSKLNGLETLRKYSYLIILKTR
jgi:hypothetical protein